MIVNWSGETSWLDLGFHAPNMIARLLPYRSVGASAIHDEISDLLPRRSNELAEDELAIVSAEAHAVIEEAKAAGVDVFGGGTDEQGDPVLVSGNGSVSANKCSGSRLKGGFTVLKLPTHTEAGAYRCAQELRAFIYDPASRGRPIRRTIDGI